jgi:replicative superfamily II helicase
MNEENLLKPVRNVLKSNPNMRDKNLRRLCQSCVGFHHAGMVRADRNCVEKMFKNGDVKILLATATLAWGVNLPAYAVIIKGTDIYDPNQLESRDLSILDVQQMFGRAGRPQYDNMGEATLMSDHNKVNHYMGALTNSSPIDSRFLKCLKESLNAEISSGTITSEDEAFDWLKYTFLAVRLKKHPEVYGCQRGANEAQK